MNEVYLCASCGHKFAPKLAIDGYHDGYKLGFLCPRCKTNLIEGLDSDDILNMEYSGSFIFIMLVFCVLVQEDILVVDFLAIDWANQLISFLLLMAIPLSLFVFINRKLIFSQRIIQTRRVRKDS